VLNEQDPLKKCFVNSVVTDGLSFSPSSLTLRERGEGVSEREGGGKGWGEGEREGEGQAGGLANRDAKRERTSEQARKRGGRKLQSER